MNDVFYLIDNNVLGKLTPAQFSSAFFSSTAECRTKSCTRPVAFAQQHYSWSVTRQQPMCCGQYKT